MTTGRTARFAVLLVFLPLALPAAGEPHGALDRFVQLVDTQSAHTLPRGDYALALRAVPSGGLVAGFRVAATDYILVGISYGASNFVGSGEPLWDDRVEFDIKLRLAEERGAIPGLALGYDSRGYGRKIEGDGYEKASLGFFGAAAKTLPFSEYWQLHLGLSRTMEKDKTGPDMYAALTARFSQEFSVVSEFQTALEQGSGGGDTRTGYLNVGLRWVFMDELELDLYFRNLVGPSGSPELASRSLGFAFYDSF